MFAGVLGEHLDFNLGSNLVNSAIVIPCLSMKIIVHDQLQYHVYQIVELPLILFQKHDYFATYEEKRVPKKTNKIHYLAGITTKDCGKFVVVCYHVQ